MNCCKVGKTLVGKRITSESVKINCDCNWSELGKELGMKWLTVSNLLREVEGKMRDFQKKGKFNLEFKNKFSSKFELEK